MKLTLLHTFIAADGHFGQLVDESNKLICFTLEHAYPDGKGGFVSKVKDGVYTCTRGQHQLHSAPAPFTTYEIDGVRGHSGILFHAGNKNNDSEGCVLLGTTIIRTGTCRQLSASKLAFEKFISLCKDLPSFQLEVKQA